MSPFRPVPTTTAPGSLITIIGGPNATANIPGPHNDSADFYGIVLALVAIVAAIAITRVVFGRRGGARRASHLERSRSGHRVPETAEAAEAAEAAPSLPTAPRRSQDPWEP